MAGPETGENSAMAGSRADLPAERNLSSYGKKLTWFLLFLLVLSCIILRPLATGISWGIIFAFIGQPVHKKILELRGLDRYPNVSASISLLLLIFLITIPFIFVLHSAFTELLSTYETISQSLLNLKATKDSLSSLLPQKVVELFPSLVADKGRVADALISLAKSSAVFLRKFSGGLIQWTGALMFQGFIAVLTMFFMLRDGGVIVRFLKDLIPMVRDERERFVARTSMTMKSVIYGMVLTVGIQAFLGGLGWYFCGLSNTFLASVAMFVCGMMPAGTAIVWAPGALYLIATGSTFAGTALLVWGVLIVGMVDNILRPIFIGNNGTMPTMAVLLGLSGGIVVWGILGVFLGPLVLATFLSVLDLYKKDIVDGAQT